jgi:putative membrane protein
VSAPAAALRPETPLPVNEARTPPGVVAGIIAVSIAASLLIFWLVYVHLPADVHGTHLLFLPALNAVLNAFSAVALVLGFSFIRGGNIAAHRASMFTAFIFSTLFLVSYLTNYTLHGETFFKGQGAVRDFYFPLLISHIGLSVIALPLILVTFFLSLSGRFPIHKRVARWTFPIWLYVSVTGVIVYAMLASFR